MRAPVAGNQEAPGLGWADRCGKTLDIGRLLYSSKGCIWAASRRAEKSGSGSGVSARQMMAFRVSWTIQRCFRLG